ncbi:hypothetical protein GYA19_00790 [Candidatus Beckwithbacteria bacterium]|nr:hypothetical protein [Candidatus Beckwithbacteria bacterium]
MKLVFGRKFSGGIIAPIGYILCPLSWWNDLILNIPLAYLFALPFGLISKSLFRPMFMVGYILTNIAGFLMLHYGVKKITCPCQEEEIKKNHKNLVINIILSVIYTLIVCFLIKNGIIKFPTEYFK